MTTLLAVIDEEVYNTIIKIFAKSIRFFHLDQNDLRLEFEHHQQ
jgi:hypothetical protein